MAAKLEVKRKRRMQMEQRSVFSFVIKYGKIFLNCPIYGWEVFNSTVMSSKESWRIQLMLPGDMCKQRYRWNYWLILKWKHYNWSTAPIKIDMPFHSIYFRSAQDMQQSKASNPLYHSFIILNKTHSRKLWKKQRLYACINLRRGVNEQVYDHIKAFCIFSPNFCNVKPSKASYPHARHQRNQ